MGIFEAIFYFSRDIYTYIFINTYKCSKIFYLFIFIANHIWQLTIKLDEGDRGGTSFPNYI